MDNDKVKKIIDIINQGRDNAMNNIITNLNRYDDLQAKRWACVFDRLSLVLARIESEVLK